MNNVMQHTSDSKAVLTLTLAAKNRILSYMTTQEGSKAVRLSVKKTGCSGLSYVIDYVPAPFEDDIVLQQDACMICIDKKSYPYLKGIEIDYAKQGLNHRFVFNNPNQTGQCGCGESFTVDENI